MTTVFLRATLVGDDHRNTASSSCAGSRERGVVAALQGVRTVAVVVVIAHHTSAASSGSSASSGRRERGAGAAEGAGGAGGARWPAAAPHARSHDGQARHTSHAVLAGAW